MAVVLSTAALVLDLSSRLILDCATSSKLRSDDLTMPRLLSGKRSLSQNPDDKEGSISTSEDWHYYSNFSVDPFVDLIAAYTHDSFVHELQDETKPL